MNTGTKRTTKRDYDADLQLAEALFDERTSFLYSGSDPEIHDQIQKSVDDALNFEWQRDITVGTWVQRAMDRLGIKGSA